MSHSVYPTVILVNPNTSQETTRMMAKAAQALLLPAGVALECVTVEYGPAMIVDPETLLEAAYQVTAAVKRRLTEPQTTQVVAVVVAAIGDPGRRELASSLGIPVIGIGQASILTAACNGRRFGMATTTPLLADSLTRLVKEHGKLEQFTGVRLTRSGPTVLAAAPEQQYVELAEAVRTCAEDDGAKAVIIAGGPLSESARQLAALDLADIVEPLPSASRMVLDALSGIRPGPEA